MDNIVSLEKKCKEYGKIYNMLKAMFKQNHDFEENRNNFDIILSRYSEN